MVRKLTLSLIVLLALGCVGAWANAIPVGYISWDVIFPGNAGQFDIINLTGPNSVPPTFPVVTTVSLSNLDLVVDFVGGGSTTYGPSSGYFTLGADGESFNGTAIPIGGTNPEPMSATLTGTFSPLSISDPGPDTILSTFSVTFSDTPFLLDGDFGVIYATEGSTTGTTVPEPSSLALFVTAASLLLLQNRKILGTLRSHL